MRSNYAGKVVVITSGKGGVGKTTTSAAISVALATMGYKTIVIDFDVGLRNLDLVMGCERRVVYDIINVIQRDALINQAIIRDKRCDNLYILPASQTRDKDALSLEGINELMENLRNEYDFILCDSPAGIEKGALMAMYYADEAVIVTNPEVSSVRDSDRILGILASKTERARKNKAPIKEHLLLSRYQPKRVDEGEMLSIDVVEKILLIPLLGMIPESESILKASNLGIPVTFDRESIAAQAYFDATMRLLGKEVPMRFTEQDVSRSIWQKLFRKKQTEGSV